MVRRRPAPFAYRALLTWSNWLFTKVQQDEPRNASMTLCYACIPTTKLGRYCDFQNAVPLVREQVVGLFDLIELEAMGNERFQVDAT